MKIWIDVVNSPHVLFFRPLIREYINMGHEVTVTAREFGKTTSLLDSFDIPYKLIGNHKGSNILRKLTGLFSRTFSLLKYAKYKNFDIALSHNSNDIAIASLFLGIPLVTSFDYEHAYTHHINVRIAKKVVIPNWIPNKNIYELPKNLNLKEAPIAEPCAVALHAVELGEKTDHEQLEQLEAELKSYEDKKPWREKQETEENAVPILSAEDLIDT